MDLMNSGFMFDITLVVRLLSALLLSFAIGLEREMTNKYAGLRTNILVCLGACIFTIISIYGFPEVSVTGDELGTRDTARVAAQVVTGIGFIGAGTVFRHGATVFGLTTAATLWVSAAIGMACGAGMYILAIAATIFSILVLVSVRLVEVSKKLNKQDENYTKIVVILDFIGRNPIQDLYKTYRNLEGIESISIQEFNE